MDLLLSIGLILLALLVGAMSPGPSFILVARISMGASRADGVAASIGMGIGGILYTILALSGLQAVLTRVPDLYVALKVFGGLYLIFIALRIWRGANQPLDITEASESNHKSATLKKSFLLAVTTQISNPKAAIVYTGIFAALLPANIPSIIYFVLPPLVFLVEAGWYFVVTMTLSSTRPKAAYLKSKSVFDRIAGGVMAFLGYKLITS